MGKTTILLALVFSVFFFVQKTDSAIDFPPKPLPASSAMFNRDNPVREDEVMMLRDHMNQGDVLLKERIKDSYSNLKELLKESDAHLKERFVDDSAQVKEQLKTGDERLEEELDESTAWLKDKLKKNENRMKEELAENEANTREELTDQKHAFDKLRLSVKDWTQTNNALLDSLKQQMTDVQAELQLSASTLSSTKDQLLKTREQLQKELQEFEIVKTHLRTAEDEIHTLKVKVDTLQSTHRGDFSESSNRTKGHVLNDTGSTFTRWGSSSCPDTTSLVYSGVVGGSFFVHTGGSSKVLCLVTTPQVDNTTLPDTHTLIYGAEYQHIAGRHDQDAVCSVCRSPQATTLMIPATLTCPAGWTVQYKGHIMSSHNTHKRGIDYVCVDKVAEASHGSHANTNGALLYYVAGQCGSLPCPPYVQNMVITCVVCSR